MRTENGYLIFEDGQYQYSDLYPVLSDILPELEGFCDLGEHAKVLVDGRWVLFSLFLFDLEFDCKLEAIEKLGGFVMV